MYDRIMVPLDGSRFAEAALPLALTLSRQTGAGVHLVTVQEPIPSFAYEEWERATTGWTREYLESVRERAEEHAGGAVTTSMLAGHVVEMLEEEADRERVDLVVMATHGRGALSRVWLGSVADAFVRHTHRPVLLSRPEDGEALPLDSDAGFSKILIPLDGSELAEAVLDRAVEVGRRFGAEYELLRVVPYPIEIASPYLPQTVQMNQELVEQARRTATEYLESLAARLREDGLHVDFGVDVDAQPGHGILRYAASSECDLIAMSTHGRRGISRALLGSATDKVLRGARVPLLLYRPGD